MSKPSTLPLWATTGGTTLEPTLLQKQTGWPNAFKPPARWQNWWQNLVYQWVQWLDAFEATAHTWTAKQTFTPDASIIGVEVTASGTTVPAIKATGTTGASSILGIGMDAAWGGLEGDGFSGTTLGGIGVLGFGGVVSAASGVAGRGGKFTGGSVSDGPNTTGAAGIGVEATGGSVVSDSHHRVGGDAVKATAGFGQDGYGRAFYSPHGGITLDDGQIIADGASAPHVLGPTQIDGDLTVIGNISVGGSITLEAVTAIAPLLNAPWIAAAFTPGFWKNPMGEVSFRGALNPSGAANPSIAFTIPAGYRPIQLVSILLWEDGAGKSAFANIATNGNVTIGWDAGYAGIIPVDMVRYRNS